MTPSESRLLKLRTEIIALPRGTPGQGYPAEGPGRLHSALTQGLGVVSGRIKEHRESVTIGDGGAPGPSVI